MKGKRLFATIMATALTTACLAVTATACDFGHEHTWGTLEMGGQLVQTGIVLYKHDETSHWKVCDECQEAYDKVEHTWGTAEEVKATTYDNAKKETPCTVCGYKKVEETADSMIGKMIATAADVKADGGYNVKYKLRANTTYYFRFKPAQKSRVIDKIEYEDGTRGLTLDIQLIIPENGQETVLRELKNLKVGRHVENNVDTLYGYAFGGNVMQFDKTTDCYLKFTTPNKDLEATFTCQDYN